MSPSSDPYQILGLPPSATEAEIKRAYRKLARRWHPDQFQDPQEKAQAEAEIKRINVAYKQLQDPNFSRIGSVSRKVSNRAETTNAQVNLGSAAQRQAHAQHYYCQAETLEKTERYQEATQALTQAIKLAPDYAEAYQYRAHLYGIRGFELLAQKDITKAKALGLARAYYQAAPERPQPRATPSPASPGQSCGAGQHPSPSRSQASRFGAPAAMAVVPQTWTCTASLKSPPGKSAGAITHLLPYGSSHGISASADGTLQLWNFEQGAAMAELQGHSGAILALDLNADGQLLASASQDGTVKLWHLPSASLTRSFSTGSVASLIFGPERHTLSYCDAAGAVCQWSSRQGSAAPPANRDRWARRATTYLGLSRDRKILVTRGPESGPESGLQRYLLAETVSERTLAQSQFEQTCLALSPSGRYIAAGDATGLIRLWDLQTAEPIMVIQGRAGIVKAIAFTPGDRLIASLCQTSTSETLIQLWSHASCEQLCDISDAGFQSLCFTGDSKRLIIGTTTGELKIWQPSVSH